MTAEFKSRFDAIHYSTGGWCSLDKCYAMAELIFRVKPSLMVEIGVYQGLSLFAQLLAAEAMESPYLVVAIDPWRRDNAIEGGAGSEDPNLPFWTATELHQRHTTFMDDLWKHGLDKHCLIIRSPAELAVKMFQLASIDILHIDGNHSEVMSCRDVELFEPLVKSGGHIWFDDCDWPSTHLALSILGERCKRLPDLGTCAFFQKL